MSCTAIIFYPHAVLSEVFYRFTGKVNLWDWFNSMPLFLRCRLPRPQAQRLQTCGALKRSRTGDQVVKMELKRLVVSELGGGYCITAIPGSSSAPSRAPRSAGGVLRRLPTNSGISQSAVKSSGFIGTVWQPDRIALTRMFLFNTCRISNPSTGRTESGGGIFATGVCREEFVGRVFYWRDGIFKG